MDENHKQSFINEKILGRDMTLQRAVKYALVSLLCGLLFGLAALGVVAISQRFAEKEQAETAASAELPEETSLPESAPESTTGQSEETAEKEPQPSVNETNGAAELGEENNAAGSPAESLTEADDRQQKLSETGQPAGEPEEEGATVQNAEYAGLSEEAIRQLIRQELSEDQLTAEDLSFLYTLQQNAMQQAAGYLVTVSTTITETTWFESTIETERKSAGIIIGKDEKEIQILTVVPATVGEGELYVTFDDGSRQKAVIRKKDVREGLVVLAVSTNGLGSGLTESIEAAALYEGELSVGQPVLTAGAPLRAVGSFDAGLINYMAEPESVVDGSRKPVYTKAASQPDAGTFLLTLSGQLVGIARTKQDDEVEGNRFLMLSSMSGLLEDMKKGSDTAYLGITGTDISFEMKSENIPEGMLVTEVDEESPAEQAGIKRGDIVISIGSREIRGLSDYCSFMRNLKPGEVSSMVISRGDRGVFQEIEISITAASR